jgi:hydrogenase/urease accessory protein HupE
VTEPVTYYRGTTAGALAVMGTFIPSGIHHIMIGPDHILFLVGLLLLGGTLRRLVTIVTAFTIGHSITLSLAALDIVNLPAWLIEPAIALSIVVVGADNLLQGKEKGRDLRAWVAGAFGLVHGFGFANVLKEFGLPQEALGWSLFSFNVGVELGQLAIVLVVASALAFTRRRWPAADSGSSPAARPWSSRRAPTGSSRGCFSEAFDEAVRNPRVDHGRGPRCGRRFGAAGAASRWPARADRLRAPGQPAAGCRASPPGPRRSRTTSTRSSAQAGTPPCSSAATA